MSNIYIYSTTPHWKPTNDIRNTRLKDLDKDEILLFKEFSWEICRLEAFNIDPSMPAQQQQASSIKLIMNPSKIQIAMKKKLSDKSLITSTLRVLLNEIYWMANDTQLKSAIGTYNLIAKLMKKSFAQRRKYATLDQQQQQQQQANVSFILHSFISQLIVNFYRNRSQQRVLRLQRHQASTYRKYLNNTTSKRPLCTWSYPI